MFFALLPSELLQEPDVVFEDQAQVADLEAAHGQALQTHAERQAGVHRRSRCRSPRAPWDAPCRRRGPRSSPRPCRCGQPSPWHLWHWMSISQLGSVNGKWCGRKRVTVSLPYSFSMTAFERALEVGHRDALVDDQALDLVEHGGVGGVHLVLAVHAARGR